MPSRSLRPTAALISTAPCLMALLPVDDLHGPTYNASLRPRSLPSRSRPTHPRVDTPALRHCAATVLIQVDTDPTSNVIAFIRSAHYHSSTETLATPLLSRALNHSNRHTLVATQHLRIKALKAAKDLGPRPSYKIQTC
jgi:hypothetical protein